GVAQARGVVDVVGAHGARCLLGRVVVLVEDPARREVDGEALRGGGADLLRGRAIGLVPGDHAEALLAAPPDHRLGQAPEVAQVARGQALQRGDVAQALRIERGRGVEAEELEADHAEVDPVHGPVAQSRGAQRAAVAHALAQDAPGVRQLVAVAPRDARHLDVVVRLALARVARHARGPERRPQLHGRAALNEATAPARATRRRPGAWRVRAACSG